MSHSIIGFGAVDQAVAGMFARKNIDVGVAPTREAEALAAEARGIGATVRPQSLAEAIRAARVAVARQR